MRVASVALVLVLLSFLGVATAQAQDGSILGRGLNEYGQCDVPAPNSGFAGVAAGGAPLGLKADGKIVAWGQCTSGECNIPAPNTSFVVVAGGGFYSLGLRSNGAIVAWGNNESGQCSVPSPNADFVAVAACYGRSLGLKGPLSGGGACCHSSGICAYTNQVHCPAPAAWQGEGTTCNPNPCPALVGVLGTSPLASRLRVLAAPNPSAGGVVIRCLLPTHSLATVVLFDASGRVVRRLHDGELPAGETSLSWDGRNDDGEDVPPGVYFATVTTSAGESTAKLILAR